MTTAEIQVLRLLTREPMSDEEVRAAGIRAVTLNRLRDRGLCLHSFAYDDRWRATELGRTALGARAA